MANDIWTASDESIYRQMSERRERAQGAQREALREIAKGLVLAVMPAGYCASEVDRVYVRLVDHAGRIRDVLEPFDNGKRANLGPPLPTPPKGPPPHFV